MYMQDTYCIQVNVLGITAMLNFPESPRFFLTNLGKE